MLALSGAVRMPDAGLAGHQVDRRELLTAVFAGVLRLLTALVKFVFASAVRMPDAGLRRQRRHTREPLSAVFAIKVRHFHFLSFFVYDRRRLHLGEARRPV